MRTKWLGAAITPALGYPLFAGILFAWDQLAGEQLLAHDLRFHRRALWDTFWSDYLRALPAFYLWIAGGIVVWLLLARAARARSPGWLIPIVGASGWIAGAYVTREWLGSGPLAFALVGALLGLPLASFLTHPHSGREA